MSEVGKTCMWTVRPLPSFGAWCGDPGVAVVEVPPTAAAPGYEMTLCARHRDEYNDPATGDGQTRSVS